MTKSRDLLIAELAATAMPVKRPGKTAHHIILWLALAVSLAMVGILLSAPIVLSRWSQLLHAPQFLLESLLGVGAIFMLATVAFQTGIPSPTPLRRRLTLPLLLLMAWIGVQGYGLIDPALAPSMVGKRAHCWLEALLVGVPALVIGCYAVRRLWPLHGAWTGALLGLASGAIPALMMQFICMYEPAHILKFHLLPGLVTGLVGALLGRWLLRPR
jgi:hypothetical protein